MKIDGSLLIVEPLELGLTEAAAAADDPFNPDGTLDMVLIRPCLGKGPGGHIYTPEMIEANHQVFRNRLMFDNHESPADRRRRGGLPRNPSDVVGTVLETRWDPTYRTARDEELGFGPGAAIGRVNLIESMKERVRLGTHVMKCSVNAMATGKKPGKWRGRKGMIVEGIQNHPETSVDLVTIAGAGGQLAAFVEAAISADGCELGNRCNDPSHAHDVLDPNGADGMTEAEIKALIKTGIAEALQEKTFADAVGGMIAEAVQEVVPAVADQITESVRIDLERPAELADLASHATRTIDGLQLAEGAKALLREDFGVTGVGLSTVAGPQLALVEAVVAEDGTVTKTAHKALEEAITARAGALRDLLGQANPSTPLSRTTPPGAQLQESAQPQGGDVAVPDAVQKLADRGIPVEHLIKTPAKA